MHTEFLQVNTMQKFHISLSFAENIIQKYSLKNEFFFNGISLTYLNSNNAQNKVDEPDNHYELIMNLLLLTNSYEELKSQLIGNQSIFMSNLNMTLCEELRILKKEDVHGYFLLNQLYEQVNKNNTVEKKQHIFNELNQCLMQLSSVNLYGKQNQNGKYRIKAHLYENKNHPFNNYQNNSKDYSIVRHNVIANGVIYNSASNNYRTNNVISRDKSNQYKLIQYFRNKNNRVDNNTIENDYTRMENYSQRTTVEEKSNITSELYKYFLQFNSGKHNAIQHNFDNKVSQTNRYQGNNNQIIKKDYKIVRRNVIADGVIYNNVSYYSYPRVESPILNNSVEEKQSIGSQLQQYFVQLSIKKSNTNHDKRVTQTNRYQDNIEQGNLKQVINNDWKIVRSNMSTDKVVFNNSANSQKINNIINHDGNRQYKLIQHFRNKNNRVDNGTIQYSQRTTVENKNNIASELYKYFLQFNAGKHNVQHNFDNKVSQTNRYQGNNNQIIKNDYKIVRRNVIADGVIYNNVSNNYRINNVITQDQRNQYKLIQYFKNKNGKVHNDMSQYSYPNVESPILNNSVEEKQSIVSQLQQYFVQLGLKKSHINHDNRVTQLNRYQGNINQGINNKWNIVRSNIITDMVVSNNSSNSQIISNVINQNGNRQYKLIQYFKIENRKEQSITYNKIIAKSEKKFKSSVEVNYSKQLENRELQKDIKNVKEALGILIYTEKDEKELVRFIENQPVFLHVKKYFNQHQIFNDKEKITRYLQQTTEHEQKEFFTFYKDKVVSEKKWEREALFEFLIKSSAKQQEKLLCYLNDYKIFHKTSLGLEEKKMQIMKQEMNTRERINYYMENGTHKEFEKFILQISKIEKYTKMEQSMEDTITYYFNIYEQLKKRKKLAENLLVNRLHRINETSAQKVDSKRNVNINSNIYTRRIKEHFINKEGLLIFLNHWTPKQQEKLYHYLSGNKNFEETKMNLRKKMKQLNKQEINVEEKVNFYIKNASQVEFNEIIKEINNIEHNSIIRKTMELQQRNIVKIPQQIKLEIHKQKQLVQRIDEYNEEKIMTKSHSEIIQINKHLGTIRNVDHYLTEDVVKVKRETNSNINKIEKNSVNRTRDTLTITEQAEMKYLRKQNKETKEEINNYNWKIHSIDQKVEIQHKIIKELEKKVSQNNKTEAINSNQIANDVMNKLQQQLRLEKMRRGYI